MAEALRVVDFDVGVVFDRPDANRFVEISRTLAEVGDPAELRTRIVQCAKELSGAEHAALAEDRSSSTLSFVFGRDDPLVAQLADASRLTHEGPEIAAISGDDRGVVARDLHSDGRWPAYAEVIAHLPVASALCVPLRVGQERLGVLALYSERPGAFTPEAVEVVGLYAHHAAVIVSRLAARHTAEHLSTALATNRRISIAIGILMIRSKLTEDEAFDRLRRTSQRLHSKLREVADYVALTGELPDHQV